jgi:hypothetical protein
VKTFAPADEATDRTLAWEMQVELASRIATAPLPPGQGRLRDELNSLRRLLDEVPAALRRASPECSRPRGDNQPTTAAMVIGIHERLLPFLRRYHASLQSWEMSAGDPSSPEREQSWPDNGAFRRDLAELQRASAIWKASSRSAPVRSPSLPANYHPPRSDSTHD